MATEVNVLRVFTDADGKFGNPLGVVSAGAAPAKDRQRIAAELGYSDTIFIDDPTPGLGLGSCRDIHARARFTVRRSPGHWRGLVATTVRYTHSQSPTPRRRGRSPLRR